MGTFHYQTQDSGSQTSGFTAVEAVLVILVVAVLGFAGWYVAKAHKPAKNTASTHSDSSQTASENKSVTAKSGTAGHFSFTYPQDWTEYSNPNPAITFSAKSPDEQEDSSGTVTSGAVINVESQNSTQSLEEYLQQYGSATPTKTTVAGYDALRLETKNSVVIAFYTDGTTIYSIQEYFAASASNPYPTVTSDVAASMKPAS